MVPIMGERRATLILLLVLCFNLSTFEVSLADAAEDLWITKEPMNEARSRLGVVVVNGKIYAIGGSTESGLMPNINGFVGTNEEYDPATDTWTFKKPMPTPRAGFAITVYQNKIYCIGGAIGFSNSTGKIFTRAHEVYDPATDTWETKASMPTARWQMQANVVDGKIYVIDFSGTNHVYDPATDSWTTKAPIPTGASGYASAVFDNKIYVVGGFSDGPIFFSNLNQIYDPETDTWNLGTPAPSSVVYGDAGATTGMLAPKRIYVFGVTSYIGSGAPPFFNQVYDPETDSWMEGAAIPTNRLYLGVAVVNDTLYAIGGHTYNILGFIGPSAVNEQYIPLGYIPEFPSWIILPLLITATLLIIICKQKLPKTSN